MIKTNVILKSVHLKYEVNVNYLLKKCASNEKRA